MILSDLENGIRDKIKRIGTPLKEWDININYGVKTGFNEAFIIDGKKRHELITQDPKSEQIIRPILRGRDIQRYAYRFADLWIINTHNGIKEKGVEPIRIEDYPAVKRHLDQYLPQLEKRLDKGITPYHLRNCAYMDDFSKQKIVWGNLNLKASYCLAEGGMFINAPCTMIVPGNKYLLAILNSKLADYYIRKLGVTRNGGYFEYKPMFIEKLPVPLIEVSVQDLLTKLVDKRASAIENKDILATEEEIDRIVYSLYQLDDAEINLIEKP